MERTKLIYAMATEVAEHRIERNEHLANEYRRAKGASEAKAARIKQAARKWKLASVREEQGLLSQITVLCDLVLQGDKSWNKFHDELEAGDLKATVVESTGGRISSAVAGRALKAAAAAAVSDRKKTNPRATHTTCYWCMGNHQGKFCKKLNAGEPCHPNSRAASWKKEEQDKLLKRRSKKKVRIEKP